MARTLVERRDVTQATLDRFRDQPFEWGRWDCARLAAFHLRAMGRRPGLGRGGSYKTALGAKRALARAGFADLGAAIDAIGLHRIPPAAALVGDIVMVPGENAMGALMIAVGNRRCVGYHEDAIGATVLQPLEYLAAWRV